MFILGVVAAPTGLPAPHRAPIRATQGWRSGALGVPNFQAYFVSAAVTQCASWLLRTTQAWLVLDLTGSPAALGLVTAAQALPVTVLTLFAGVLIDRTQTRRLLLAVQAVFGIQAAILAILVFTRQIQFWHVMVLALILGVASAFDFPTRSAIVSELVEPPLVGNGIALNSALNSAARIIGPGVGGFVVAVWGSGACFALTAVAYVGGTACLALLRSDQLHPRRMARKTVLVRQLSEGLRYSFSTPSLAVNMILAGVFGTFAYNWALVLPLIARFALDSGAEGFGLLNMAMGLGSTLGAFVLATRVKPSMRLLLCSAAVFSAFMLILAHAPNMPIALLILVATGFLSVLFNATNNTLIQVEAREEFRGRVLSLYTLAMIGSTPFGSAITGLVANSFDVRLALEINAGVCLCGLIVAALFLLRARAHTAASL
jgi:MFS family permease